MAKKKMPPQKTLEDGGEALLAETVQNISRGDFAALDDLYALPGFLGGEALDFILGEDPDAYVIMLTSVTDEKVIQDRMLKGAQYYLPKHNPPDEIKAALQENIDKIKSKMG